MTMNTLTINADVLSFIDNAIMVTSKVNAKAEAQHYAAFVPSVIKNHLSGTKAWSDFTTVKPTRDLNREIVKQDTSIVIDNSFVIGEPVKSIVDIVPTQAEIKAFRKSRKIINIAV
jgi:hypothetical protein